jgi:hypothetical protein
VNDLPRTGGTLAWHDRQCARGLYHSARSSVWSDRCLRLADGHARTKPA